MNPTTLVPVTGLPLACITAGRSSLAETPAASARSTAAVQAVAPEQLDNLLAPIAL
jgi:hypothetical protein